MQEYQKISVIMQNEIRILKEKLRVKKSMQELRRTQLLGYFNACIEELERWKRDYLIDLENNELMFEQEFETIQDNIDRILEEVNKETFDAETIDEFCNFDMFTKTKTALTSIVKYFETFLNESETNDMGDFLISYNRDDLRWRINTLWENSLKHKQNTNLFDFNFENNRIIKTEIIGKGALKDFLIDEGDEYKVSGIRDLKSFVNNQTNNGRSALSLSVVVSDNNQSMIYHQRNKSSISSILEERSLIRYTMTEDQYRKMYVKYKEVDAHSRSLIMSRNANIPKQTSVLSLKEGRIFFIGGSIFDKTSSIFIEYLEEHNTIYLLTKH